MCHAIYSCFLSSSATHLLFTQRAHQQEKRKEILGVADVKRARQATGRCYLLQRNQRASQAKWSNLAMKAYSNAHPVDRHALVRHGLGIEWQVEQLVQVRGKDAAYRPPVHLF